MVETEKANMDVKQANTSVKIMRSVLKLFVQMSTPNYSMPWQMKRQQQSKGSGFVISNRRILTNAHVVAYQKSIHVRKHGDAKKYVAHVIHVAHQFDIAMVGVADEAFWEDLEALQFGDIPELEEDVVVVGFPTGGDNISVTRGVVSRVDIQRYSHSGTHLLAIQIDAAINAGNSGGPALKDGKVVGIAFETLDNAENIGYIIPSPVVNHFLTDIEKHNTFTGVCNLGIRWQPIESQHMRTYFKLSPKETGILVSTTLKLSCSYDFLQRGDVLMSLNGVTIADNGTVPFRGNERILWNYLIHSKFPNEKVQAIICRAGEIKTVEICLTTLPFLVPPQLYDMRPSYVVYCGLVFVALSQPYMLHQYGKDWGRKGPIRLCDRILYGVQEKKDQEVVILSQVLASELTAGYDGFANIQLYRVNGIPILNLRHLCHVLDQLTLPHVNSCTIDVIAKPKSFSLSKNDSLTESIELCQPIESLNGHEKDFNCKSVEVEKNSNECIGGHKSRAYSEFTSESENFYHGIGDDPLLLDCTNFVHFELDKDKVVVFHIASAYSKNSEILTQYAISSPRSNDLPEQVY
ncbi:uncharacterized protein LOC100210718 isoform X2 [Hydra vulgaris]|uniref:uncharacterized protein LOC100210718 isoform X2 n=1 Tax=Hydra vulgaris TaxID=6087 RepID=UPI001F5F03FA|nr:protease Do-like 10, mitochondrial isoform X1 [Hydra vulgaris]